MLAVVATRPGPPGVLEAVELPQPSPGPGQVGVAVQLAATTFIDTQLRGGGGPRPLGADAFPVVLGNGVGGTVVTVGDGVDPSWYGTTVVATTGGRGGYATHALAGEGDLHRVPDGVDLADAVALLADGRTALALHRAAAIVDGERVAVTAAAGGVGSLLVQLAVEAGATVVALARGGRKLDHAHRLGAAVGVEYTEPGWDEHVGKLDVAFDGVGGAVSGPLAALVQSGGRYVPHGMASGEAGGVDVDALAARGVVTIPLSAIGDGPDDVHRLVDEALARAADGRLRPTIGQVVPLVDAAAAHAAMEARTIVGKTLLRAP